VVTMRSQALAASLVSALARCRTALSEAEPGQMWRPEALAFDSISSSTKWSSVHPVQRCRVATRSAGGGETIEGRFGFMVSSDS